MDVVSFDFLGFEVGVWFHSEFIVWFCSCTDSGLDLDLCLVLGIRLDLQIEFAVGQ